MVKVDIDIKNIPFPTQYVPDSEKETKEFGLKIGQSIQYEWFRKDGQRSRFYDQWTDYHRLKIGRAHV